MVVDFGGIFDVNIGWLGKFMMGCRGCRGCRGCLAVASFFVVLKNVNENFFPKLDEKLEWYRGPIDYSG